jgi:hypothetical protein
VHPNAEHVDANQFMSMALEFNQQHHYEHALQCIGMTMLNKLHIPNWEHAPM